MSSLENKLQRLLTDEVSVEFRMFCLLLQAYSDTNVWSYDCNFYLKDNEIYWDRLFFYGGGQSVEMEGLVKYYFSDVIRQYINVDELLKHIDSIHYDDLINTGWLYFTIYPKSNKLTIDMAYDYFDYKERHYEENISDIVRSYANQDKEEVKNQLKKWEEEGAKFEVSYEGSNWNEYINDECVSNVGISRTPRLIEDLGELMINIYEKGYHLEGDGGSGILIIDFKEGTIFMEHTEYGKSSYEVELAELTF